MSAAEPSKAASAITLLVIRCRSNLFCYCCTHKRLSCRALAAEYARVMRTVSEVDFDLYLHTV